METHEHSLKALFDQLGLDSSEQGIEAFVSENDSIPQGVLLWQAPMWSESQAQMLKQMKDEDADWAEVVDELDLMMR
ncbi:hypothetical protein MGA5115_00803 [Marinomonas gallaica]|uniref:DUF2789 domain-containing protein n=1 Tax=Marinomonas gallaica TaxID=1806667 RepID=A0A1C3JNI4_9GAMM|nr:DUF2789 domain-containing protein [Marinomonas gallaica]SBT16721.1 hypothetical protein MGA5115_00803 [Marinomonas gallaica]SBT20437.1 hypothetical protein MGA5116_01021 [Marinomonas gallaica]